MDDRLHSRPVLLHDLHCVRGSLPAVDRGRHMLLRRKLKLTDKPVLLRVMPFLIPVIVQPDLTDGNDLLTSEQFFHPAELLFVQRSHLVRVYADHAIDKRILLRKLQDPIPGLR